MFLVFKQYYMYFYTFFHPHVFSKNTNNIIRIALPNSPKFSYFFIVPGFKTIFQSWRTPTTLTNCKGKKILYNYINGNC